VLKARIPGGSDIVPGVVGEQYFRRRARQVGNHLLPGLGIELDQADFVRYLTTGLTTARSQLDQ
jgi:hypothetical protein